MILTIQFCTAHSQNYNFSFSQNRATYSALGIDVPSYKENWTLKRKFLSIGFHFQYQGQAYDSLEILPMGEICFDATARTTVMLIKGLMQKADTNGTISFLRFQTSGNTGQRVFKLEYIGAGVSPMPAETIEVQLWLYEQNGAIELHYGPNSYANAKDSTTTLLIGPINWQMNTPQNGFLLTGNPQNNSVTGVHITSVTDLKYMVRIPDNGTVFTLIPSN